MSIGTTSNMEWLVGNGGGGSVEYAGGHGITIDNVDHIISVDQSEIQDKLTAGENITIQNNVISANPQRQSDWNQSDSDAVDYIRNKPQNLVQDASYTHTDNNFTTADKSKLDGIESGAQANVQADWNESDSSSDAFIKNKPSIPSGDQLVPSATSSDEGKILTVDSNGDPEWQTLPPITGSEIYFAEYNVTSYADVVAAYNAGKTVVVKSGSHWAFPAEIWYTESLDRYTFIFTTNYTSWTQNGNSINILKTHHLFFRLTSDTDHPTQWFKEPYDSRPMPTLSDVGKVLTCEASASGTAPVVSWVAPQTFTQVQSNWNESDSSAVSYIQNKPSIPTATSDLTNDSNFITASDVPGAQVQSDWAEADTSSAAYIAHKPTIPTATSDLTNDSNFITASDVPGAQTQSDWTEADTSSPAYIANKPTIPTVDQSYSASSSNAQSGTAVAQAISGVDAVPDVTSSDAGKVLVATYSGGTGSYEWASTPPANAIILTSSSTWADFHTAYSAGRKDIYYKHTSPYSPFETRAELYLHLTAVSDVDGTSTNFTFALFEGAWNSGGVNYSVRCKFKYSGGPSVFVTSWVVDQSYSASSYNAQSGTAVAQAISAVNQVPSSTSADEGKVLTVDSNGDAAWATNSDSALNLVAGTNVTLTKNGNDLTLSASGGAQSNWNETDTSAASYIQNKPSIPSGDQLLPPASASDDGKVLKVNSAGHPIWVNESSLNLIAGTGITITETAQGLVISLA